MKNKSVKITIHRGTNVIRTIRSLIRLLSNTDTVCPIKIVPGDSGPTLVGSRGCFKNKRGDIIRHPTAYKNAWGKPIYHKSTLRIEVGADWFNRNLSINDMRREKLKLFR